MIAQKIGLSVEDTKSLYKECGYYEDRTLKRVEQDIWRENLAKWKQSCPMIWHCQLRAERTRASLMDGKKDQPLEE